MKRNMKIAVLFLTGIIFAVGIFATTRSVEVKGSAVEIPRSVQFIKNSELNKQEQIDVLFGEKAPTKEGYLFGGWYEEIGEGKQPIKTMEQLGKVTGEIYAKFVPAQVLSVKSQNHSGTKNTADQSGITSTRIISAVDSLNYLQVGFEVWLGDTLIGVQETKDVYSNLVATKEVGGQLKTKSYSASLLFGESATKFIVLRLNNVGESLWNDNIYVRPFWKTFDGVTVKGLAKYVYVQDGIDGLISVPINIHTRAEVAAGMLSVDFPSGLQYKECCAGTVFKEMDAMAVGNTVKCVGNVEDIANVPSNDMYITLRFKVTDENFEVGNGTFLDFIVKDMNFCNIDEKIVPMQILNVRY